MNSFSMVCLTLAGIGSLFASIRFFKAKEFLPYHATLVGQPWSEISPRLQQLLLSMLRVMGGGFVTYGASVLWLTLPISRNEAWASWSVLCITVTFCLPVLYVTFKNRHAKTPFVPTLILTSLALAGALAQLAR